VADKPERFPTQPALVGNKVFLRPATPDDMANMHYWFIQTEPQAQTSRPQTFRTPAEVAEAFKKRSETPNPDRQTFAIVRKSDKTLVGRTTFFNYNSLNRSAELGVLIDPDERKKGHAKDALQVLVKYLFKYWGLNKVYAQTADFNVGAVKLIESLHFKKDGTLRDHHFFDGEFHAAHIYSLLLYELDW
jgi:RimJ/RimL family protein N-acetyltransferase